MIQAVLEITIKFLTELISFELPVYMYIWFAVLFIFSMIVENVQLAIAKDSILNSILKKIRNKNFKSIGGLNYWGFRIKLFCSGC